MDQISLKYLPPSRCPRFPDGCAAFSGRLVLLNTRRSTVPILDKTPATKQDRGEKSFLDLPSEIRNKIYAYALTTCEDIPFGVVALEPRGSHHWHPAHTLHRCREQLCNSYGYGLRLTPLCPSSRPHDTHRKFSLNILLACRQLHKEGASVLYGQNTFSLELDVSRAAEPYNLHTLKLDEILPFNSSYHHLLRSVSLRLLNEWMKASEVRVFSRAMMDLLQDVPGAYLAYRRRPNALPDVYDHETFAGWSPTASPSWIADARTTLATSRPLKTNKLSKPANEIHLHMSMLWEMCRKGVPKGSEHGPTRPYLDLMIMSDPATYPGTWRPEVASSRDAARVFLVHLCKIDQGGSGPRTTPQPQHSTSTARLTSWNAQLKEIIECNSLGLMPAANVDDLQEWTLEPVFPTSRTEWVRARSTVHQWIKQPGSRVLRKINFYLERRQKNVIVTEHRDGQRLLQTGPDDVERLDWVMPSRPYCKSNPSYYTYMPTHHECCNLAHARAQRLWGCEKCYTRHLGCRNACRQYVHRAKHLSFHGSKKTWRTREANL